MNLTSHCFALHGRSGQAPGAGRLITIMQEVSSFFAAGKHPGQASERPKTRVNI